NRLGAALQLELRHRRTRLFGGTTRAVLGDHLLDQPLRLRVQIDECQAELSPLLAVEVRPDDFALSADAAAARQTGAAPDPPAMQVGQAGRAHRNPTLAEIERVRFECVRELALMKLHYAAQGNALGTFVPSVEHRVHWRGPPQRESQSWRRASNFLQSLDAC